MVHLPTKQSKNTWHPLREIDSFQREMNRLFGHSFPGFSSDETLFNSWVPAVDIENDKDAIVVKADLPGIKKEDIDVTVEDNVLTIHGEKKQESKQKDSDYLKVERYYGSFHRSIALPAEVDSSKVNAAFKDGVLEITLQKSERAKPKQIKIDVK